MDAAEEQAAFEALMDAIMHARTVDPHLHIYHFAPYEPTALKRLAGRYATRQDALDELLRGECFVDLYAVVRQAIRAGVESYSIKELEQYFGYTRAIPLRDAATHRIAIEIALEIGEHGAIREETREIVEQYNRDDVSPRAGCEIGWTSPDAPDRRRGRCAAANDRTGREEGRRGPHRARRGPSGPIARWRLTGGSYRPHHPDHPRWLLAFLIDWHHREEKANWWEYFRLQALPEEDLMDEPKAHYRPSACRRSRTLSGKEGEADR